MAANVDVVKAKVQAILTENGPVQIDADGDFSFGMGSTRVFIRVLPHPNDQATVLSIFAPVLINVPRSAELYEFLAMNSDHMIFGHLTLAAGESDDTGTLLVTHKLLGDYLDAEELMYAAVGVVGVADQIDEDLQAEFGGKRFADS